MPDKKQSLDKFNEPYAGLTHHKSPKVEDLPKPVFKSRIKKLDLNRKQKDLPDLHTHTVNSNNLDKFNNSNSLLNMKNSNSLESSVEIVSHKSSDESFNASSDNSKSNNFNDSL
ncbi:hypothetical protein EDEG_03680 [Edhazardia aedis USNM 41457]|uniref:Uncharacterized protein n=1 Tax=Edhazardia aedis (strain USNM 41457) TaxID=1003232 RepID=J9D2M4_EDHAE|nr:hypothetical protein EDEG_03680 [Edhazardia aedis USNM 41457]|eukprot:EJW01834.1 hypothetical protein EDEG_03680 [Edhazardia aedis USNM 41457]